MAQRRAVTMAEIARRLRVSRATVSHVVTGRASALGISAHTQRRVLDAIEKSGYRPNASARAMKGGRLNSISLVLSNLPNRSSVVTDLIEGVEDQLASSDLHLSICRLPDQELIDEGFIPKILRELTSDGLLVKYEADIPGEMINLLRRFRVPTIWLNSKQRADCVCPAEHNAGVHAVEHLLELGHRRIAMVNYTGAVHSLHAHYSAADRISGYEQAMRRAGLTPMLVGDEDYQNRNERMDMACQLLSGPDRPTAVIARSATNAWPVLLAALRLGLNVPRDLSIITFHHELCNEAGVPLTTMVTPERQMGRVGARLLLEKIDDPEKEHRPVELPYRLEIGATTGPLRPRQRT